MMIVGIFVLILGVLLFFYLLSSPYIPFDSTHNTQHKLSRDQPVVIDENGKLTQIGWYVGLKHSSDIIKGGGLYQQLLSYRVKSWKRFSLFVRSPKSENDVPDYYFDVEIFNLTYGTHFFLMGVDFINRVHHVSQLYNGGDENNQVNFVINGEDWNVDINTNGIVGNFALKIPKNEENFVSVVPIGNSLDRFVYTTNVPFHEGSGNVIFAGKKVNLSQKIVVSGLLELGQGIFEYQTYWLKCRVSTKLNDGKQLSLVLTSSFGNETFITQNALILDGAVYKLGSVVFEFDTYSLMNPWKVVIDGKYALMFAPFSEGKESSSKFVGLVSDSRRFTYGKFISGVVNIGEKENEKSVDFTNIHAVFQEYNIKW